jgi:hypothetical protein
MSECDTRVSLLGSSVPRKNGDGLNFHYPFSAMNDLALSKSFVQQNGCPTAIREKFFIFPLDTETVFRDEL